VGDEVYEAFAAAGFDMSLISQRKEKWHINLPECNRLQLIEAGIPSENIDTANICTMKQSETFFSARRLGIQSGRIFTGINIIAKMIILLMTMFTVACSGCGNASSNPELTPEELRVQASQRIDSTLIQEFDSLSGKVMYDGLSAEAWIMAEDSSGLLISAKNIHQRMPPASLTKMMTCMLALEQGNMSDTIVITPDVFIQKDSRVRLGDSYLLGHLIQEMMLQSDNDAANAIAKHIGGDIPAFCRMMNDKAAYLGMDSTHFANPNGITNDSTYSTARDLLVLARYCMRDSIFAEIVSTPFIDIPLLDGRHLPCDNTNLLLRDYDGCIGIKTGYTRRAGGCLASAATRKGKTLILILLNSKTKGTRFKESSELLDYGFLTLQS
jgi:D-alanyl-D-alanine carboxypeptidase